MNANMMFRGVTNIFLPVKDLDRSIAWYTDVMGFKLLQKREAQKAASMDIGAGQGLSLVQVEPFEPMRFPKNHFSVHAYFNFHTDDIDKTHAVLREKGIDVSEIEGSELGFRHFSMRDIDGNWISVVND